MLTTGANRHWLRVAAAIGGAIALTIAFHWSFNAAIPDLLQVPEASFKQSLGLVLLAAILGALLNAPRARYGRHASRHTDE